MYSPGRKISKSTRISLLKGKRDQTLQRLRAQPWAFSSKEMDRLLVNFRKDGVLSLPECWDIVLRRVAHRAQNSTELLIRLEGRLLLAVALGNEDERQRLSRLLTRMKMANIQG